MSKVFLLAGFLFLAVFAFAQEPDSVKVKISPEFKNHVHGGLFVGYTGISARQPAVSYQVFYDRFMAPYIALEAAQGYFQSWERVEGVDTLAKIGKGYFKSAVAVQFVYPKVPKKHSLNISAGPSVYYAFVTRLVNDKSKLIGVIPPAKGSISAGIAGTIQYRYYTKKNVSVGVMAAWDYVFQKNNFFANILPGFTVGARFK